MATNGTGNPGMAVTVLYKVANSGTDEGHYNAFTMPRSGAGVTLASVKQHCAGLQLLNILGPDGYHWRVRVDEKSQEGGKAAQYSWWDIQDENARLPVREIFMSELETMFGGAIEEAAKAEAVESSKASSGIRSLGRAVTRVAGAVEGATASAPSGPRVPIIAFKLLDLVKMEEKFGTGKADTRGSVVGRRSMARAAADPRPRQPAAQAPAPRAQQPPQQQGYRAPTVSATPQRQNVASPAVPKVAPPPQRHPQAPAPATARAQPKPKAADADLMGFGSPVASAPKSFQPPPNETRAQKLQREYKQKNQTEAKVWDDVDQRWVSAKDAAASGIKKPGVAAPPPEAPKTKTVGIKLDPSSAVGKSANVQAAVNKRVTDMKNEQEKALKEIRLREQQKKNNEAEEDDVRKKLEPKIKAWSEEHGKKKQLRALLSSLHTILWPEAQWKAVSLGDILDENKCKRCFHKASRVVHPDKTGHLDAEKRFLAKRIFDALSQAKTEFDGA